MDAWEFDKIGDLMKAYEGDFTKVFPKEKPLAIRLDGKSFHTFTKGLNRPYDEAFAKSMVGTAKELVKQTGADLGYTQSDEITLIFLPKKNVEIPFGGKVQKLCSVFASIASVKFNELISELLPHKKSLYPVFDCRCFSLPDLEHVYTCLLWRETDAIRNSLQMLATTHFTPKQLFKKGRQDLLDMLQSINISWEEHPESFKRGVYVKRKTFLKQLSIDELERIPFDKRPTQPIERREVVSFILDKPIITYRSIDAKEFFELVDNM